MDEKNSTPSASRTQCATPAEIRARLGQQLGPEYLSYWTIPDGACQTRDSQSFINSKLAAGESIPYVEEWKLVNLANETFGFDGWSSKICDVTVDFVSFVLAIDRVAPKTPFPR